MEDGRVPAWTILDILLPRTVPIEVGLAWINARGDQTALGQLPPGPILNVARLCGSASLLMFLCVLLWR